MLNLSRDIDDTVPEQHSEAQIVNLSDLGEVSNLRDVKGHCREFTMVSGWFNNRRLLESIGDIPTAERRSIIIVKIMSHGLTQTKSSLEYTGDSYK